MSKPAPVKASPSSVRFDPPERAADPARDKNIELAVSAITKQFGEGSIMRLGSATRMVVDTISTGSLAIDLTLGGAGWGAVVVVVEVVAVEVASPAPAAAVEVGCRSRGVRRRSEARRHRDPRPCTPRDTV